MTSRHVLHLGQEDEIIHADDLAQAGRAARTVEDRQRIWRNLWVPWCEDQGFRPLPAPAETWLLYLEDHQGLSAKTLRLYGEAVRMYHVDAGWMPPTADHRVEMWLRAYRRTHPAAKGPGPVDAATLDVLGRLIMEVYGAQLEGNAVAARTRAHMLSLYSGGARHDDLSNVVVDHPRQPHRETGDGHLLWVVKSKNHQTGGYRILIPHSHDKLGAVLCPGCAVSEYIQLWKVQRGALFQSTKTGRGAYRIDPATWEPNVRTGPDGRPTPVTISTAARAIKAIAEQAGLTKEGIRIATHSFKAGFVTQEYRDGTTLEAIAAKIRTSENITYQRYLRLGPDDLPRIELDD